MAVKKDFTEEFLMEFRKVEQLIKQVHGPNVTFRDVESIMEQRGCLDVQQKMQLCRNVRNYASHNPDINTFMPIPEEACNYLRSLYNLFESEITTVKDTMSRTKALTIRDNIVYAAQRLGKLSSVPVVSDDGIILGAFTNDVLRKCVSEEMSLKARFGKGAIKLTPVTNAMCVQTSMPMKEADDVFVKLRTDILYVTSDGTTKGKYIGTVVRQNV